MIVIWNPFLFGRGVVEFKDTPNLLKKLKYNKCVEFDPFLQDFENFMLEKLEFKHCNNPKSLNYLKLKKNFDDLSLYIELYKYKFKDWVYPGVLILKIKLKNKNVSKSKVYIIIKEYYKDKIQHLLNHFLHHVGLSEISEKYINNNLKLLVLFSIKNSEVFKPSKHHLINDIIKLSNNKDNKEYVVHAKEPVKTLKDKFLQLNKNIINSRTWLFPLSSYDELYSPHHQNKEGFNLFTPIKRNNLCYITIPMEILKDDMDIINRRKLKGEVNTTLDFITILLCIIYGLSKITYESLTYIEKKLFNPFAFNLNKKYKEYETMEDIDFVDYNSTINIMNLAILLLNDTSNSLCKINETIFIETLEDYMNLLYEDINEIDEKIERFISLHDNIIVILIGLLTVLVTIFGLLR